MELPGVTPLIGRAAELASLVARIEAAGHGRGGAELISGEPGIGKSTLARAAARAALERGALTLWGRCLEGAWAAPFAPWAEAIGGAVRSMPDADLRARLAGDPRAESAATLARIVPELQRVVPTGSSASVGSLGDDRDRLHDATLRFLSLLAGDRLLLIVLDDLQWADAATIQLAGYIASSCVDRRLLLLATYRELGYAADHPLHSLLPLLRREANAGTIHLKGLAAADVETLITELAPGPVRAPAAAAVRARTKGNPFFIAELLRHLTSAGAGPDWSDAVSIEQLAVPESVRHVVERRVERLSEPCRTLLRHAAIFSGGFDFAVLPALTGLAEDALLDAIDEALAARLIEPAAQGPEQYDFVHAIVRHALLDSWSPSRRVRLHRRVAEALLSVFAGREESHAAALAAHFHGSRSLPGAEAGLPYALLAADRARAAYDIDGAVTMLRIARDLAEHAPPPTRARVLTELAVAEADALHGAEALATTGAAVAALAVAGSPDESTADFIADAARALKQRAYVQPSEWRPLLEDGLRRCGEHRGRVWAKLRLLEEPVEPIARDPIRAGRWVGFDPEAIAIARATGDEEAYARSFESFDLRTRAETEALIERARGWSRPAAIMYGLTVAANDLHYRHGAFRDAAALWQELIDISDRRGAINWQAQATNQVCWLRIAEGRFAEARALEAAANALLDRLGPGRRSHLAAAEMATCFAVYLGGDWPALARFWTGQVNDPALGPHDPCTLTGTLYAGLAAYAAAEAGDTDAARRMLEALVPILERMQPTDTNHNGAVGWAGAAVWRLGLASCAPPLRRLAANLIDSGLGDYPQTSNELTLARMAALLGNREEAERAFAGAQRTLGESGQRPLAAIAALDEAAMLARGGPTQYERVRELLTGAVAELDTLEMAPWLARAEAALADAETRLGGRAHLPGGLTEREADVLRLVARGYSDRQVSDELYISPRTVNAHLRNMLNKTAAANRTELSIWAFEQGIVTRDERR